jgi:hypothetical protein
MKNKFILTIRTYKSNGLIKRQLPVPVAKRERFETKVLLCVWWNYEGPIYYKLVPDGRTRYILNIGENVYSFARKVPSAIEPKARVTSTRKRWSTNGEENFRKSKNW